MSEHSKSEDDDITSFINDNSSNNDENVSINANINANINDNINDNIDGNNSSNNDINSDNNNDDINNNNNRKSNPKNRRNKRKMQISNSKIVELNGYYNAIRKVKSTWDLLKIRKSNISCTPFDKTNLRSKVIYPPKAIRNNSPNLGRYYIKNGIPGMFVDFKKNQNMDGGWSVVAICVEHYIYKLFRVYGGSVNEDDLDALAAIMKFHNCPGMSPVNTNSFRRDISIDLAVESQIFESLRGPVLKKWYNEQPKMPSYRRRAFWKMVQKNLKRKCDNDTIDEDTLNKWLKIYNKPKKNKNLEYWIQMLEELYVGIGKNLNKVCSHVLFIFA